MRHPRQPARAEGRHGREARNVRRHLPQRRLHSLQGAAARVRAVRGRPATHFGVMGIDVKPKLDLAQDARLQGRGREGQHRRRRLPAAQEQGRSFPRHRAHQGAGRRRGDVHQRREAGHRRRRRSSSPRARRVAQLPGIEIDENGDRVVHRRAVATEGAQTAAGHRRRRYRTGARLGVAAARRRGDGRRVSRPRSAGHRRRGGAAAAAHPRQAGHDLQARSQGDGRCQEWRRAASDDRAVEGRRRPRRSRRMSCSSPSAACRSPRGWAWRRRA